MLLLARWSVSHTETTCKCCPVFVSTGRHCGTWSEEEHNLPCESHQRQQLSHVACHSEPSYSQFICKTANSSLLKPTKATGCYVPRRTAYHILNITQERWHDNSPAVLLSRYGQGNGTPQAHQFHSYHIQLYDSLPTTTCFLHIKIIWVWRFLWNYPVQNGRVIVGTVSTNSGQLRSKITSWDNYIHTYIHTYIHNTHTHTHTHTENIFLKLCNN